VVVVGSKSPHLTLALDLIFQQDSIRLLTRGYYRRMDKVMQLLPHSRQLMSS
jgi:hypothetical protein